MSLRHSKLKLKMLVPALVFAVLFGISAGVMILMFQDTQCEKPHREGSLPALLCPSPSDSSSLR